MSHEIKTEEYNDLAKRVSRTLYQDLQRSPDEPLSITVLMSHLKHRMGWHDQKITNLQQHIRATSSGSIDYQDIVRYLSTHTNQAQELQQHFLTHSISAMPKVASWGDLRGHQTISSYFLQPPTDLRCQVSGAPMFVPPQLYVYDQTSGIPLSGTTHRQGGGTVYQNPLYHGSLAFAASPPVTTHTGAYARKSVTGTPPTELEDEYDQKTESNSSGSVSDKAEYEPQTVQTVDMADWVRRRSGNKVIQKLLIANNGIAAVKCMKHVRMWCYDTFGDMNAIHFVCMATPEDINSNAEYIRMAEEVVPVPGGSNNYNYANVTIIVTIAKQCKCDAVWPGWGHASEYPSLPRALAEAGIGWIGPDADAMYASGDKIMSTLIAQHAKVPTVQWSGSKVKVKYNRGDMSEVKIGFKKSCINSLKQAMECADEIGYPVMIKASEGGGGKGIRKCSDREEMESAYNQVVNEVPGSPIFIMKLASNARHLEVQLLGDQWGNVIALFGRDCSMQRRHQKIIEEGPIINVDPKLLLEMEESAVALAKSVHYVGAGTVEFLYDNDERKYYFLELNPRLQVEHPVTELISGINLPAAQVMVAMGIPLHCMTDIRRLYAQSNVSGTNEFEFLSSNRIKPLCHTIACRITAENPLNNFTPTSGLISELHFRSLPNVWGYFSLKTASSIHDYADSQFGHIFASGATRDDARKSMVLALSELEIRGKIRTTIEFLSSILENEEYIKCDFHTTWLEAQVAGQFIRVPSHLTPEKIVLLGAVASGQKQLNEMEGKLLSDLEHGRNINIKKYRDHLVKCFVELIYHNVKYIILIERTACDSYTLRYQRWKCDAVVRNLSDGGLLVSLDGRSHVLYASHNGIGQLVVCCDGHTVVFEQEYDPSTIKAVIPGKLVKILCSSGQHVEKGESFAEIEVMKMYMPLIVPEAGEIEVIAQEGSILQIGQKIATLELDDMEQVRKAEVFSGSTFGEYASPEKKSIRVNNKFMDAHTRIKNMLDGYIAATDVDNEYVERHLDLMMNALRDPALPLDEFNTALEPLRGRIDESLYATFKAKAQKYSDNLCTNRFRWEAAEVFPSESILAYIAAHKQQISNASDVAAFEVTIDPLRTICARHRRGTHYHAVSVICELLETFCLRESRFIDRDENIVIQELRRETADNLESVAVMVRSHFQLKHREAVIMELLNIVDSIFHNRMYEFILELTHILERMTTLTDIKYGKIHLKSREILASIDFSSETQRKMEIETMLTSHIHPSLRKSSTNATKQTRRTTASAKGHLFNDEGGLLRAIPDLLEILPPYMLSENENVACNAVELWIRSVFAAPFYFVDKKSMSIKWQIEESTQCSFSFSTVNPKDPNQNNINSVKSKKGFFGFFANLHQLKDNFKAIIDSSFPAKESLPIHVIILGFKAKSLDDFNEKEFTQSMEKYFTPFRSQLNESGISFISVFVPSTAGTSAPHLFTFRYMLDFREDPMTRHILPPLVTMLEMDRLKMGFQIQWMPTENRRIHIFEAAPMEKEIQFTRNWDGKRLFARVPVAQMVNPSTMVEDIVSDYYRFGGPEFALMEATHALDSIISSQNDDVIYRYNHILLACFFDTDFAENSDHFEYDLSNKEEIRKWKKRVFEYIYGRIRHDYELFAKQLKRLHVTHIEIRFQIRIQHKTLDFAPYIFRAFLDEPGNGVIQIHLYVEKTCVDDDGSGAMVKLIDPGYGKTIGRLHGTDAFAEHIVEHNLMAQRITAKNLGTTYVYDWPVLFHKALQNIWYQHKSSDDDSDIPFQNEKLIEFEEFVVDKAAKKLVQIERRPGQNKVAMVVWKVKMKTPEFPQGRSMIIASNDIANNLGTFSLDEDETYNMACNWAQADGLPFIYLSANSGARIGLSQQLIDSFKVCWEHEESQIETGMLRKTKEAEFEPKYLYLDEETYSKMKGGKLPIVNVQKIGNRYKILDIIGSYGIGVENLSGSGLIAGTTSRASFNTFTLSYVTGRSVGIGAYLVRLAQRIIQKEDSPILLTGYVALNNLLGKSVYLSNQQIGGADQVMMPNGVSHYKVTDDLEGAYQILKWLSYVPAKQGDEYPIEENLLSLRDPIDRDVTFYPASDKYDPRCLIAGDYIKYNKAIIINSGKKERKEAEEEEKLEEEEERKKEEKSETNAKEEWLSGLFDRDSFTEYLASWARSVVIGRARLGGIPCGIIATETRTTQCVIPPDPALEDESKEISFSQPGQVWYPDSSYKTSQAIRDFATEQLPLFILANWRGFSGGQRDMFHEILKYGSYIVDELADYAQPVFIYLPPTAELRGGAWVVLDSLINERVIEMYAAQSAKANVLEPTGTIGLKFRKRKLLQTMHRIDPQLINLDQALRLKGGDRDRDTCQIKKEIENRERGLFPIYNKIALMFAKLHDTPQRMKDVGVIRNVVQWKSSRTFFYWRLRRKLVILKSINQIRSDIDSKSHDEAQNILNQFIKSSSNENNESDDDKSFVEWFKTQTIKLQFDEFRKKLQKQAIERKLKEIVTQYGNKQELKDILDRLLMQSPPHPQEVVVNID